jgi:CIC family chloride channel protein
MATIADIVPEQWVRTVAGSALAGLGTGLVILGVKVLVEDSTSELLASAPWVIGSLLFVGAVVTSILVRFVAGGSSSTTDRYIEQFRRAPDGIDVARSPGRLAAAITTGASGAPMGLEGPAVYAGGAVATAMRRWLRPFATVEMHALLVAGAAAGVATVFKAPLTGVLFALEVPARNTFERSAVIPALIGSTVGYLTLISVKGTEPVFPVASVEITVGYVFGAVVVGLLCGLGARTFAWVVHRAERMATRGPAVVRGLLGGAALVAVFVVGRILTGENVAITAGFNATEWALDPENSVALLLAVLAVRVVATTVAVGGGMVGGLFVPLIAMGGMVGAAVADLGNVEETSLYVLIGGAAFLAAGYGTPLAALAFVAESTGLPGFLLPGVVAVTAAQIVMSNRTVSAAQTEHHERDAAVDPE